MSSSPPRCLDCLVRDTSLCSSLLDSELISLSQIGRRRVIPAGQVVSWAGEPSTICANIVGGSLKVTAATADGREQIVALLFPGDFVGQLFEDEASLTVTTLAQTDLCFYPRAAFERTLDDHPRMERVLLQRTMASLNEARGRMLALARETARERVAGFLLDLVDRTGHPVTGGGIAISIPVSRGEMADFLGLTIETVSRQLSHMKEEGLVAFDKGGRDCRVSSRSALATAATPADPGSD